MQIKWSAIALDVVIVAVVATAVYGVATRVTRHDHKVAVPVKYLCSHSQYEAGTCDPETDADGHYVPAIPAVVPKEPPKPVKVLPRAVRAPIVDCAKIRGMAAASHATKQDIENYGPQYGFTPAQVVAAKACIK